MAASIQPDSSGKRLTTDELVKVLQSRPAATADDSKYKRVVFVTVNTDFDGFENDGITRKDFKTTSRNLSTLVSDEFNWETREILLPTNHDNRDMPQDIRTIYMLNYWADACDDLAQEFDQEDTLIIFNGRTHAVMDRSCEFENESELHIASGAHLDPHLLAAFKKKHAVAILCSYEAGMKMFKHRKCAVVCLHDCRPSHTLSDQVKHILPASCDADTTTVAKPKSGLQQDFYNILEESLRTGHYLTVRQLYSKQLGYNEADEITHELIIVHSRYYDLERVWDFTLAPLRNPDQEQIRLPTVTRMANNTEQIQLTGSGTTALLSFHMEELTQGNAEHLARVMHMIAQIPGVTVNALVPEGAGNPAEDSTHPPPSSS